MNRRTFLFETCGIDAAARELWRGEDLVLLPPRVFDVLAYLLEHLERAIGRDELIAAVWGRTDITGHAAEPDHRARAPGRGHSANEQTVILFNVRLLGHQLLLATASSDSRSAGINT